jgi:hypothetical protein
MPFLAQVVTPAHAGCPCLGQIRRSPRQAPQLTHHYDQLMASPFAFRMRAYAAAHFPIEDQLVITWPDAVAILQSEYTGGSTGRAYPVTLFGEIRGDACSLDEAQVRLSSAIGNALPIVALAANAAIDDPMAIGAFGLDTANLPQEFMWYATPRATDFFPPGIRKIHADATLALMTAIGTHSQSDLLQRAAESYRRALTNWVPERVLMAGEFLYIAAETLSRFLIEARSGDRGISRKNLAKLAGASDQDALRDAYLRDEIFGGDAEALKAMRDASDGFEHGYMAITDVRDLLESALARSMTLVRRSLVTAAGAGTAAESVLLGDDYGEPRGLVPAMFVVRGDLRLKDPGKAPPADLGVGLELAFPRPVPTASDTGLGEQPVINFKRTITALQLPDNIEASVRSSGLRAAHVKNSSAHFDGVRRADEPESQ